VNSGKAHFALYDTLNDSEAGLLLVELRTGRFTGAGFDVITVAESRTPITTLGGVRVEPDVLLADLDPADSDVFVLAGAEMWDRGGGEAFAAAAGRFLEAGTPVAAICGVGASDEKQ
jgi:putative intracellular protease/amidase